MSSDAITPIVAFAGGAVYSEFKLHQRLGDINRQLPEIKSLCAQFCYLVQTAYLPACAQTDAIANVIDAKPAGLSDLFYDQAYLVMPRLGTISPWSSKATEIVQRCGLSGVLRVERAIRWRVSGLSDETSRPILFSYLHDRMVESVIESEDQVPPYFASRKRRHLELIDISVDGHERLVEANVNMGLALSTSEIDYIFKWYEKAGRNPTDVELMMFSQVNSEHCRHKIFNASWTFDGVDYPESMFSMIRKTHANAPRGTLVAYEDNAAVIEGRDSVRFHPDSQSRIYSVSHDCAHIIYKAETHNHPTAISPFPGAATGAGGEIRDEGATGIGGKPKAGLCGYSVSHLRIPDLAKPWEDNQRQPERICSPLKIMLEAPIGAASFNNEFGRPNIGGYFRTFESSNVGVNTWMGYHKPIMFAGGIGNIGSRHLEKSQLKPGDLLVVLGGPAMLIGLGGGAASSLAQGHSGQELDFASVQRSNPEMQRRCQEVIDRCRELKSGNPILSIHDVGAGGLSNALPEIVHASNFGATIDLDQIPSSDHGLSPLEIWCNEAQERYVLSISSDSIEMFEQICHRELCPFAVIGTVAKHRRLTVTHESSKSDFGCHPVDMDMDFLMDGFVKTVRSDSTVLPIHRDKVTQRFEFNQCVNRVLRFPSVADKSFLITISDRTVTGLIHRDQMVGPWQVPVADAAVTLSGYFDHCGEAMALGERAPLAVLDAPASARMAVAEALTNLRSTPVDSLNTVKLSANWMAAAGQKGVPTELYKSVESVAINICYQMGISIPVGKDSLSMFTQWNADDDETCTVSSPVSLIVTAFCSVADVRRSLTPQLHNTSDCVLLLIDLGGGKNRMGMSVLHQSFNVTGCDVPDLDDIGAFIRFFRAVGDLMRDDLISAYHDRSDGGLFVTLAEMAFAGRCALDIDVSGPIDPVEMFFNEELGAVIEVERKSLPQVIEVFEKAQINSLVHQIGSVTKGDRISISVDGKLIFESARSELHRLWSELTWKIQSIRDNRQCAEQEYDRIFDASDPGLTFVECEQYYGGDANSGSESNRGLDTVQLTGMAKPKVAILRQQGVNGHVEMAAAFDNAGFCAVDVMMSDLKQPNHHLTEYEGIVLGGGFSFGDVLGAGRGWALTILHDSRLRDSFEAFFANTSKFALGVCNGCQVMTSLKSIIPGAQEWPDFVRNQSEQFEARLVMVEVSPSNSIFTQGMQGSFFPIAIAHGEGKAAFAKDKDYEQLRGNAQISFRYTNHQLQVTDTYPYNPNGSRGAVAGLTNLDGRIMVMMPHPERVFKPAQFSWIEKQRKQSPWMNLFHNARAWLN